jgi:hypothetical protein
MPYIKQSDREKFIDPAKSIANQASCAGDLNYAISLMLHMYINKKGLKYSNLNEVIGMLECCKLEMYRMVTGPYEDTKISENGPVSNLESTARNPSQNY